MNQMNDTSHCPICQHPYGKRHRCYKCEQLDLITRFWKHVKKTETCWIWAGKKTPKGYGKCCMGDGSGQEKLAHRISWIIHNGPIPDCLCVLHHCDNPSCVRPDHLFVGTQADNIHDMHRKGRHNQTKFAKGEQVNTNKLIASQVISIRTAFATGNVSQCQLAKQYNVCPSTIQCIVRHRTWKHIP